MPTQPLLRDDAPAVPRSITRDPLILGGRWRLDGTSFAIAEIKADHAARHAPLDGKYHFMDLTPAELEAALAFVFPDVRETRVELGYGFVTVACQCGEDTYGSLLDVRSDSVHCICGREWLIRVYAEPKPRRQS